MDGNSLIIMLREVIETWEIKFPLTALGVVPLTNKSIIN